MPQLMLSWLFSNNAIALADGFADKYHQLMLSWFFSNNAIALSDGFSDN
jgi:hypothetical protein